MKAKIVFTGIISKDAKTGNKYLDSEILETSEDKFQLGLLSLTELTCRVIFCRAKERTVSNLFHNQCEQL